jgi:hypothetical protein
MCFAGKFPVKTYKYWSVACEKDRIPKNKLRTDDDVSVGNYHFWCVDRTTNKIVDNTPPTVPPDERRIKEEPVYIPWCEKWQKEQRDYCINNLYNNVWDDDGFLLSIKEIDDWLVEIVEEEYYEEVKCFRNSYALWKSNPEKYNLVCGSFGWVIDETKNNLLIGLDYGW